MNQWMLGRMPSSFKVQRNLSLSSSQWLQSVPEGWKIGANKCGGQKPQKIMSEEENNQIIHRRMG